MLREFLFINRNCINLCCKFSPVKFREIVKKKFFLNIIEQNLTEVPNFKVIAFSIDGV